jgi:hypothetical protein
MRRRAGVAHSILAHAYVLLTRPVEDYADLGGQCFDERDRLAIERLLVRWLEGLAYHVSLEPTTPAA